MGTSVTPAAVMAFEAAIVKRCVEARLDTATDAPQRAMLERILGGERTESGPHLEARLSGV